MPWLLLAAVAALIFIAGGKVSVVLNDGQRRKFVTELLPVARQIHQEFGIPPNISLAQWAHETGYGTGNIYLRSFNLGSITADDRTMIVADKRVPKPGQEERVYIGPTHEWVRKPEPGDKPTGKAKGELVEVVRERGFRKYPTALEGARDWARMLATSKLYPSRYSAARTGDLGLFAREMRLTNYATDPDYEGKMVKSYGNVLSLAQVA